MISYTAGEEAILESEYFRKNEIISCMPLKPERCLLPIDQSDFHDIVTTTVAENRS
jgi:hypothetical protein